MSVLSCEQAVFTASRELGRTQIQVIIDIGIQNTIIQCKINERIEHINSSHSRIVFTITQPDYTYTI